MQPGNSAALDSKQFGGYNSAMSQRVEIVYLDGLSDLMQFDDQAKVAAALGINESTISLVRNRKRGAGLGMALKLARYYGVRVEDLVHGKNKSDAKTREAVNA